MNRLKFGAFLAPHHPIGEHPTLQFESDLEFVSHLDRLGYDEFWCGEHHSTGWEMIASPELFLAAAAVRTARIRLGTGVVSLPYHHPFMVAERLVQLDHQSRGRVIFGSGPGALPSDAHTLGVDPMTLRDRQDEAMGVIKRLLAGEERFDYDSEWFTLRDARLQLLPLQDAMEMAVASAISPSGMTLAGKHSTGVLSIGSTSTAGLQALPLQWSFAEESAAKHGGVVHRAQWRLVLAWHVAETREEALRQAGGGLLRHSNDYLVGTSRAVRATCTRPRSRLWRQRPGAKIPSTSWERRTIWSAASRRCRRLQVGSGRWSVSCTTGRTVRTRCVVGTSWRATSSRR